MALCEAWRRAHQMLCFAQTSRQFREVKHAFCAGGRSMFLARFIHGESYKARPDVNAVIHSHSPAVIPSASPMCR
jgi:hypothetical protein